MRGGRREGPGAGAGGPLLLSPGEAGGDRASALAAAALLWLPGGQRAARDLYAAGGCRDPEEGLARHAPRATAAERAAAMGSSARAAERGAAIGARAVPLDSPRYPGILREIADPPPLLFALGELPSDWDLAAAVVGTRSPAQGALEAAERIVGAMSSEPRAVVVSGLAVGVDARAHRAALERGLRTVAVMAGGLDGVYPPGNRGLFERIARAGCCVSERPVGMAPDRAAFVLRDRIQSGLSRATFLVQSEMDGGSMHTARYALAQGRALVALRPLGDGPEWGGNAVLVDPDPTAADVRAARMGALRPPFAHAMAARSIERFVEAGLRGGFLVRERDGGRPLEPSQERLL